MSNEMFQARLDDDFAEEVHQFREERHMSKSEAVRAGLRELVNAGQDNEAENQEGHNEIEEQTTGHTAGTDVIEKGYRFSKQLADAGVAICMVALGAWLAVTLGLVAPSFGAVAATVTFVLVGFVCTFLGMALALGLQVIEATTGLDADPQLRRLDLRRVVAS
jgi:Arc/MetJ-type ribon-helix-helix transcriptional regulator